MGYNSKASFRDGGLKARDWMIPRDSPLAQDSDAVMRERRRCEVTGDRGMFGLETMIGASEVAEMYGISRSRLGQIENRAFSKLIILMLEEDEANGTITDAGRECLPELRKLVKHDGKNPETLLRKLCGINDQRSKSRLSSVSGKSGSTKAA